MNTWIFYWLALKLAYLHFVVQAQAFVPSITSVSQISLSIAGGTRLSIRGNLISDLSRDKIEVYIGQFPCRVLLPQTTTKVVTCEAPPGLSGTYGLTATINSTRSTQYLVGLTYRDAATPVVHTVRPSSGPPGSSLSIMGMPHFNCSSQGAFGDYNCIGNVLVGPYRCLFPYADIEEVFESVAATRANDGMKWGEQAFRINCTMPGLSRNNPQLPSQVPGVGTAGLFNVTLSLEAEFSGATASTDPTFAWLYSPSGRPYMYEQYPEVTSVTPSAGSLAGGTAVTIRGRGFPNTRLMEDSLQVLLAGGGSLCTVVESSFDTIRCVTTPAPALLQQQQNHASPSAPSGSGLGSSDNNGGSAQGGIRGQYPGLRGVEYQFYPFQAAADQGGSNGDGGGSSGASAPSFSELWRLNSTLLVSQLQGGYSNILMDRVEGRQGLPEEAGVGTSVCRRFKGFFVAPRATNYTFVVKTGGYAQLNASWIQDGQEVADVPLINITPPSSAGWANTSVPLAKDQPILLELTQCGASTDDVPRLGVRLSSSVPWANSIPEIQALRVSGISRPPTITVRYLYGSLVALDGIRVTMVAGTDGQKLPTDPRVGLRLDLGDGSNVVVPLGRDAAELRTLLAVALNVSDDDDGSGSFSVRQSANDTTLVLELAAAQGALAALHGNISAAITVLPGPGVGPTTPAPPPPPSQPQNLTCQFANPLLEPVPSSPAYAVMYRTQTGQAEVASTAAQSGTLDLSNLNVTVQVAAVAVPAVPNVGAAAGGRWRLRERQVGDVRRPPVSLSYNATPAEVAQAVRDHADLAVSVTRTECARIGFHSGSVWQLTLQNWEPRSIEVFSHLLPEEAPGFPEGALLEYEFTAGVPPGSGSISIAYGDGCEWVDLYIADEPLDVIGAKLASLPGIAAPIQVGRTTQTDGSIDLTFTFNPTSNPGDRKPLRVVDASGLVDDAAVVSVTTISNGTTDQLFLPIPVSMMRLAVAMPGSVQVLVNDALAACMSSNGSLCAFSYEGSLTPSITAVDPVQLSYDWSQTEIVITVSGEGFTPLNETNDGGTVTVTIGGAECSVLDATDTAVQCALPRFSLPAGLHILNLQVEGKGYATGAVELVADEMAVYEISPPVVSAKGMTLVNVSGQGFHDGGGGDCSRLRASIGAVACPIVTCSPVVLTLLYPGAPGGVGSAGGRGVEGDPVVLKVLAPNGTEVVSYTSPPMISVLVLTYAPAVLAVEVSSASPGGANLLSAAGGLLLVSFSSDVAPGDVQGIYLVPSLNDTIAQANRVINESIAGLNLGATAFSLKQPCLSVSWPADFSPSSPVAICTTGMIPCDLYHAMAVLSGSGLELVSGNTVSVDVAVTIVSPSIGSAGGGTVLTVVGTGFSSVDAENHVLLVLTSSQTTTTSATTITAPAATEVVPCDVLSSNDTLIKCRTRPYGIGVVQGGGGGAAGEGGRGEWVMQVQVAVCAEDSESGVATTDGVARWETCLALGAGSRCGGSLADCLFRYAIAQTPIIGYVSPASGTRGTNVTVYGRNLANVTELRFAWQTDGTVARTCSARRVINQVTPDTEAVLCTIPSDMPYGLYKIILVTDGAAESLDPYQTARFTCQAIVSNVQPRALSLAGGITVAVSVQSSGGLQPDGPDAALHVVLGAGLLGPRGLSCPDVIAVSSSQLSFTAPPLTGLMLTELWSLPYSAAGDDAFATPAPQDWGVLPLVPDAVFLAPGATLTSDEGFRPPAAVLTQPLGSSWAARFTFYIQVVSEERITLSLDGGIWSAVWVDGNLASSTSYGNMYEEGYPLKPGLHKFLGLIYKSSQDSSGLGFRASIFNSPGAPLPPDMSKVIPVPPGTPLPVTVFVNGAPSAASCASATLDLRPQSSSQQTLQFEAPTLELTYGSESCSLLYSTYMTPTLIQTAGANNGVELSLPRPTEASERVDWVVHLYGSFLTQDPVQDMRVTVGGWLCEVFNVTRMNSTEGVEGKEGEEDLYGNGAAEATRVDCMVPPLPWGRWPVEVMIGGLGAARPRVTNQPSQLELSVALQVNDPWDTVQGTATSEAPSVDCQVSLFGGGTISVMGTGFVAGLYDNTIHKNMSISWDASSGSACTSLPGFECMLFGFPTPPVAAIATTSLNITLSVSRTTATTAVVRIGRYSIGGLVRAAAALDKYNVTTDGQFGTFANDLSYIGNASARSLMLWRMRLETTSTRTAADPGGRDLDTFVETTGHAAMCGSLTPWIYDLSPISVAAETGRGSLTVSWRIAAPGLIGDGKAGLSPGSLSNASLEFEALEEVGGGILTCSEPRVTSSTMNSTWYHETFTCTLPPYMPASSYTVWLCLTPYGCGYLPSNWSVVPSVAGFESGSATEGPALGGTEVVIRSSGHSLDPSIIGARFGNSTCAVTAANRTSFTCTTGPLPFAEIMDATAPASSEPTAPLLRSLFVTPILGASEVEVPEAIFTFRPDLDIVVLTVSPTWGPSSGGTILYITGRGFSTAVGDVRVFIGDLECGSVSVSSNTSLTCATPPLFSQGSSSSSSSSSSGSGSGGASTAGLKVTAMLARSKRVTVIGGIGGMPNNSDTAMFQYLDLWSSPGTWPMGRLPEQGEDVAVAHGTTVMLDISPPPLGALTLYGNLVFDETQPTLELQATSIVVDGGGLLVGASADLPYSSQAILTLTGQSSGDQGHFFYGNKVLAVRNGRVQMYGMAREPPYTTLNATVDPGEASLLVNGPVNWQVGDQIVILSSSVMADEVDEAALLAVEPQGGDVVRLVLDTPLSYTHLGVIVHPPDGTQRAKPLDVRTLVAVLSRNVRVRGDAGSADRMYGAHVLIHTPDYLPHALVQFSNVEFVYMGQASVSDSVRYSLHWFMQGDVSGGDPGGPNASWVCGCAVHHAFARGVVLTDTHGLLVHGTVVYDVYGHAFVLNTGAETGNVFAGNLGALTRASPALTLQDTSPATFWVTNPNNTFRNNVAAGSDHTGFAYFLSEMSYFIRGSANGEMDVLRPSLTSLPVGGFNNNVAHSHLLYGVRIHPEYEPMRYSSGSEAEDEVTAMVFQGLVAYRNGFKGFAASKVGAVQLRGAVLGGNGGGPVTPLTRRKDVAAQVEIAWVSDLRSRLQIPLSDMAGLHESAVYGTLPEDAQKGTAARWLGPLGRRVVGVATQSASPLSSLSYMFDSSMALVNVTFLNFDNNSDVAGSAGGDISRISNSNGSVQDQQQQQPQPYLVVLEACARCWPGQGGATTFTSGIQFVPSTSFPAGYNASIPVLSYWSWPRQGVYEDLDGSLLSPATLGLWSDWKTNNQTTAAAAAAVFPQPADAPWIGATFQSAVDSEFFDSSECIYLRGPMGQSAAATNDGAVCAPSVGPFRRVFLDRTPTAEEEEEIGFDEVDWQLVVVDGTSNLSMIVSYNHWTEGAAMILVPTRRNYDIRWRLKNGSNLYTTSYTVKDLDALNASHFLYFRTTHDHHFDCVRVNDEYASTVAPPPPFENTTHGASSFLPAGNSDAHSSTHEWLLTVFLAGDADAEVDVQLFDCPSSTCGCPAAALPPGFPPLPPGISLQPPTPLYPTTPPSPLSHPSSPFSSPLPPSPAPLTVPFRWSNASTWALRPGGKPAPYDNVTIEAGWNILLDESPPPLSSLVIRGAVRFDPSVDVELRAYQILVVGQGSLSAGSKSYPHPSSARILLMSPANATETEVPLRRGRQQRRLREEASLVTNESEQAFGSKVLAVLDGGKLELYGRQMAHRWVYLAKPVAAGETVLVLNNADGGDKVATESGNGKSVDGSTREALGWKAGDRVLVTSTSYNQYQSEIRRILSVIPYSNITADAADLNRTALVLDTPLQYSHAVRVKVYSGPADRRVNVSAEVALLSSNVVLAAAEAYDNNSSAVPPNSWYGNPAAYDDNTVVEITTGAQLYVGNGGTVKLRDIAIEYCGQGSETHSVPCVVYDNPASTISINWPNNSGDDDDSAAKTMESYIHRSAVVSGAGGNLLVAAGQMELYGNVFFGSYGTSNVQLWSSGNTLKDNLALGAVIRTTNSTANVAGINSSYFNGTNITEPGLSNYWILDPNNWIQGNVAAGSDRFGFIIYGGSCSDVNVSTNWTQSQYSHDGTSPTRGSFIANVAHACLVGMWLQSSADSRASQCTALTDFTAHTNWDFGLITLRGIDTNVQLHDVRLYDNKHAGAALLLRRDIFTAPNVSATWQGGFLAGRSSEDVCAICTAPADDGCHQRLVAKVSYNAAIPYTPTLGLIAATFAQGYSQGPVNAPWDVVQGYGLVYGQMYVSNVTIADFAGDRGCGGGGFAFANNPAAPDAFHPHYFRDMLLAGTITSGPDQGLFRFTAPDPAWRTPADCGTLLLTTDISSSTSNSTTVTLISNTSSNGTVALLTTAALPYPMASAGSTTGSADGFITGSTSGSTISSVSSTATYNVSLNCAGPAHVYFRDMDGTLLGEPGAVVGVYADSRQSLVAQGSLIPLPNGRDNQSCSYIIEYGSYVCTGPSWLDPQLFVLASHDNNSETQGPDAVLFEVPGAVDAVVPAMDQSWCFGLTSCQRRLSAFWTYLPMNTSIRVSFLGTPPIVSQVWMPYAEPGTEIILAVQFPVNSTARRFPWLLVSGRPNAKSAPPELYDGSSHGSYFWDPVQAVLYVKMVGGGSSLQIRAESAAVVAFDLSMHIADFTNERHQRLVLGLAMAADVLESQLQIMSVMAGSVQINLVLYDDPQTTSGPLPDPWLAWSAAATLDASSQAALASQLEGLSSEKQSQLLAAVQALMTAADEVDAAVSSAGGPFFSSTSSSAAANSSTGQENTTTLPPPSPPLSASSATAYGIPSVLMSALLRLVSVLSGPTAANATGAPVLGVPRLLAVYGGDGGNLFDDPSVAASVKAEVAAAIQTAVAANTQLPPPSRTADASSPPSPPPISITAAPPDAPKGAAAAPGEQSDGGSATAHLPVILAVVLGGLLGSAIILGIVILAYRVRHRKRYGDSSSGPASPGSGVRADVVRDAQYSFGARQASAPSQTSLPYALPAVDCGGGGGSSSRALATGGVFLPGVAVDPPASPSALSLKSASFMSSRRPSSPAGYDAAVSAGPIQPRLGSGSSLHGSARHGPSTVFPQTTVHSQARLSISSPSNLAPSARPVAEAVNPSIETALPGAAGAGSVAPQPMMPRAAGQAPALLHGLDPAALSYSCIRPPALLLLPSSRVGTEDGDEEKALLPLPDTMAAVVAAPLPLSVSPLQEALTLGAASSSSARSLLPLQKQQHCKAVPIPAPRSGAPDPYGAQGSLLLCHGQPRLTRVDQQKDYWTLPSTLYMTRSHAAADTVSAPGGRPGDVDTIDSKSRQVMTTAAAAGQAAAAATATDRSGRKDASECCDEKAGFGSAQMVGFQYVGDEEEEEILQGSEAPVRSAPGLMRLQDP